MDVDEPADDGRITPAIEKGVRTLGCRLVLVKGKAVTVEARFPPWKGR